MDFKWKKYMSSREGKGFFKWIFVLSFLILPACRHPPTESQLCFKDHCFQIELALTVEEQHKGLMFRESLDPKRGMLFIFQTSDRPGFWMKNTKIPLDILWLNEGLNIVDMALQSPPCQSDPCPIYYPQNLARYVLEVNAGMAQKIGIAIGDHAEFQLK